MRSSARPGWQQLTALVSLSAGGAITGFNFVPGTTSDLSSPTSVPVHLMALEQSAKPTQTSDETLRSAIVNVANYYLRMAKNKTPAEMEAIIWQHDSVDGADHGQSCAAFASLMLELAAQVVGQQSWVTGGSSYPWPLHDWVDARVNPNPASMGIISIQQDAAAHGRWHPLGDGYQPQPGDWVVFDGHVEVVTKYAPDVLQTVGGDSLPNFSVNAHEFSGPLPAQGVVGFVNNGALPAAPAASSVAPAPAAGSGSGGGDGAQAQAAAAQGPAAVPGASAPAATQAVSSPAGGAAIPGAADAPSHSKPRSWLRRHADQARSRAAQDRTPARGASSAPAGNAAVPGLAPAKPAPAAPAAVSGTAAIPGLPRPAQHRPARAPATPAHDAPAAAPARAQRGTGTGTPAAPANATSAQQAFIDQIAPGAMATQQRYGVPAAVTIAQAIDESGWGQSGLATRDHNLFGMKGTGPAGSDLQPTQEFENGQMVSVSASFRVYRDMAESIEDHGKLLATSGYYTHAMAQRRDPDAFAAALTGVYATDPQYGTKLVSLMQQYDLYRYDRAAPAPVSHGHAHAPAPSAAAIPGLPHSSPAAPGSSAATGPVADPAPAAAPSPPAAATPPPNRSRGPSPTPSSPSPSPSPSRSPRPTSPPSPAPARSPDPAFSPSPAPARTPDPASSPAPGPSRTPAPSSSPSPGRSRTRAAAATPAPAQPPAPARSSKPAQPGRARPAQAARTAPPEPGRGRVPRRAPAASPSSATAARTPARAARATPAVETVSAVRLPKSASGPARRPATRRAAGPSRKYQQPMPASVKNAFIALAKVPIIRAEPLYRDVASNSGIRWELLAACDWMECESRPRYSPIHGEKLGTRNSDGTVYRTKSEALAQCADDLVELASVVYGIDLTSPATLSVRDLANVFAAFRWGGLLKLHRTSAMEFPYAVAGLTDQHARMRWPNIDEPHAPDRPGSRFRLPFGAVPVVLSLSYPATA